MKIVKKLGDYIGQAAWKLIYDKDFNKHLKLETVTYDVYSALLSQSGTSDPVAVVLDDTTNDTITFSRNSEGYYTINSANLIFTTGKTTVLIGALDTSNSVLESSYVTYSSDTFPDTITIRTGILSPDGGDIIATQADNILDNRFIEIRIYK